MKVLKEAEEPVSALSALFGGGGSQSSKLGSMTFAADPSGLASMFSGTVRVYWCRFSFTQIGTVE